MSYSSISSNEPHPVAALIQIIGNGDGLSLCKQSSNGTPKPQKPQKPQKPLEPCSQGEFTGKFTKQEASPGKQGSNESGVLERTDMPCQSHG